MEKKKFKERKEKIFKSCEEFFNTEAGYLTITFAGLVIVGTIGLIIGERGGYSKGYKDAQLHVYSKAQLNSGLDFGFFDSNKK